MKNIKHYLDILDEHRDEMALALMSDPGLSKTSQCKEWCEEHGRNYYEFITSQRMPSEISGMAMPDADTKRMKIYDFDYLLDMKDGDMLAFDEFTNGNIMTLNACLTLIQERSMLSGRKLPSILVVAMGNHQGQCDLLPQTKQRFIWLDVKFDAETWCRWIEENIGANPTKNLRTYIKNQYESPFRPTEYNYLTARTATNLLKLAQTVSKDDPIWKNMPDVTDDLVNEIYKSIDLPDWMVLRQQFLNEIDLCPTNTTEEETLCDALIDGVKDCTSRRHLKYIIEDIEDGKYGNYGNEILATIKGEPC